MKYERFEDLPAWKAAFYEIPVTPVKVLAALAAA